jgi:nicotinamide-nucleotide amidase
VRAAKIGAMKAAFLAVGSELLGTDRVDTNSLRLTEVLERFGVAMERKAVIGDDEEEIADEVRRLLGRVDLVVVSGGLGPTADDVTRAAVARALGRELRFDEAVADDIRRKFESHGLKMPEVNRRQAEIIEGAERIPNRRGTAPGMRLDTDGGGTVFLFPGPPNELDGMIATHLEPWLSEHTDGGRREHRTLKVASLPESTVEERITPAYRELGRETLSILAQPGEIRLRFWAEGSDAERRERLDLVERRLRELVGAAVFTADEDEELEAVVGALLRRSGRTVVTAESCTGGLVAERLTRVPGSSDYFLGGAVTYTDRLKRELLGVSEEDLRRHGAVSEPVARAMARGIRDRLGADFGLGITGVAGPGGGSEAKPVGTVHLAVAGPDPERPDGDVVHRKVRFPGDRERVRSQSGQLALELLRRRLLDEPPPEEVGADQLADGEANGGEGREGIAGSGVDT